ncbi:MAG: hypothetical protein M3R70_10695 [Actinomycetota bacterium]|nr:hypothetical protein [Actinomycetota bacterium]
MALHGGAIDLRTEQRFASDLTAAQRYDVNAIRAADSGLYHYWVAKAMFKERLALKILPRP